MCIFMFAGGPHVTMTHDAIGQSLVTWDPPPPQPWSRSPLLTWGTHPDMLKGVHWDLNITGTPCLGLVAKQAVGRRLKGIFVGS